MKIQTLDEDTQKTVQYFGSDVVVPTWVNWMAVNPLDNTLEGFSAMPTLFKEDEKDIFYYSYAKSCQICKVDLEGLDWQESLRYVGE